jgi:type IV pilus assembly protein PilF
MIKLADCKYQTLKLLLNSQIVYFQKILFLLSFVFFLSACSPLAAIGMIGSTVSKTIENSMEDGDSSPAQSHMSRERQLEEIAAANLNLGVAYMQQGKYRQALEKLNRAKLAKNDYAPVYNALGLLHQRLGENEIAESNFKKAIKLNPNDSLSLNNYGLFLCQSNRFEEADSIFLEAAENPFYKTPEIAITNAGTCALSNDKSDIAENYFREALGMNPNIPPALIQMAKLSYERNDYLGARDYLQRYLKFSSHTSKSLWLGVRIEQELGDKNTLSSYALLLRNNFPDTKEAELLEDSGVR